jgi:3-dehydroquinate synthase
MKTCWVELHERRYPIYIGEGLLSAGELLRQHLPKRQVMIVSNPAIADLYLATVQAQLPDKQCDVVLLPEGEAYKTLETLSLIFDELLQHQHHRSTQLVALGGGVIGDMTGFAASCYQRGVSFIQLPTSLLAQVDASVGGKTAVNHPLGKNMIGAFYQPNAVIIDTNTLSTLPPREFQAGLAEVIKHALIRDADFFTWLEQNIDKMIAKEPEALQTTIYHCCQIKAEVVANDEREQGLRAILNFGHTFGHAFEAGLGYGYWLHGEAVAAGMVVAAQLSIALGTLALTDLERIKRLLHRCHLPTEVPATLSMKQCFDLMSLDKKIENDQMRFVLLKSIGDAYISDTVSAEQVRAALRMCGLNRE